jgi:hypothetical protein
VIIRVLGEGQYEVPDERLPELNELDSRLAAALESGVEDQFRAALDALLDAVHAAGVRLPDEELVPSDVVVPHPGATAQEVRDLLSSDGLVPG